MTLGLVGVHAYACTCDFSTATAMESCATFQMTNNYAHTVHIVRLHASRLQNQPRRYIVCAKNIPLENPVVRPLSFLLVCNWVLTLGTLVVQKEC